jgi:hypothetical protein
MELFADLLAQRNEGERVEGEDQQEDEIRPRLVIPGLEEPPFAFAPGQGDP